MYALILNWDLSEKPKEIFQTLREYIANESWKRYENKKGLVQKVWYSNEETGQFGGIYLWEIREAMEEEIRTMYRIKSMTGVDPTIPDFVLKPCKKAIIRSRNLLQWV